jgi:hypothetical protein
MKQSILGFVITAALFGCVSICRAAENMAGRWEGSAQIPGRELTLIVDLSEESGAWTGSVTIPGLGVKGRPLKDIVVKGSEASFAIKSGSGRSLEATFKAHLTSKGMMSGDFVQAGNTAPFVLKQTGPPQVEVPLRSTPISQELEGEWKGSYEIFGSARQVTIKLVNRADGATADFVIVGKKTTNLPVDLVRQEGDLLTIDSHDTGIGYEGRLNKETAEIKGTFIQGPIELPLILHRAK